MRGGFVAANDQYLRGLRDLGRKLGSLWLDSIDQPSERHIAILRAGHSVGRLGYESVIEILSADLRDGFGSIFRGDYELADWQSDYDMLDREDDELLQLAAGFVLGVSEAWEAVRAGVSRRSP